jgi:hypothetical protein
MTAPMNFALVRMSLLKRKFTPEQFAKMADICVATVYNILAGRPVSLRTAFKVSEKLNVPLAKTAPRHFKVYQLKLATKPNRKAA